ncbi:hypothetical protein [Paenibacillus curdlanolyticus]|nr:hypothetical protein [Paenibacillus curdlanolyticus]
MSTEHSMRNHFTRLQEMIDIIHTLNLEEEADVSLLLSLQSEQKKLLEQIVLHSLSASEMEVLKDLLEQERELNVRLSSEMNKLNNHMTLIRKAKQSKSAYQNDFSTYMGAFIDSQE